MRKGQKRRGKRIGEMGRVRESARVLLYRVEKAEKKCKNENAKGFRCSK